MKPKRSRNTISLTADDVNVLSIIAQQSELPEKFLLDLVDALDLSDDARKVALILIQNRKGASRNSGPASIASQFSEWARSMSDNGSVEVKLVEP